ncbi:TetR/AcrR family transcriptional regulator [Actinokineospora terrae]|uniref:Transcriptional regulator, TetR family n=1 Tax=Actinokineospora terrae TaxID=155974 RepID=A0A1H9U854_9PSEU|nr:TetR/AcrR family transcriptional regulator C-terminal domain-containing protein [Actinokineospora terrae]SES05502.1 transcriptional regulator, TetR family [Actinokineospora terrae]
MEYAGRGDAARTMMLLWDGLPAPQRGPRQRLDLPRIVDTAIAEADRAGPSALSMRSLAQALGIGAASLYTYVPGKAELLELMVDRVAGTQSLPSAANGWQTGLRDLAESDLANYRAHPWLLQIATSRTVFGPNVIARYEAALALLDGLDLPALDIANHIATLDSYTRGAAAPVVEAEQAFSHTGNTDDEWWTARAPLLDERLNNRFPHLTALATRGAFTVSSTTQPYTLQRALDRFTHGLSLLLDALTTRVTTAKTTT